MSQIKDQLQKVAPISLSKRVWIVVKDRNGATPQVVASVLKETPKRMSGILAGFAERGMMTRVSVKAGTMARARTPSYHYTVPAKFTEYELLPLPKAAIKTVVQEATQVKGVDVKDTPHPDLADIGEINIDKLTIAQARVLWKQLNQLFKS